MTAPKKPKVFLEVVAGVEGTAVYLNGYRIIGPKPWGGGPVVHRWEVRRADIREAMKLLRTKVT